MSVFAFIVGGCEPAAQEQPANENRSVSQEGTGINLPENQEVLSQKDAQEDAESSVAESETESDRELAEDTETLPEGQKKVDVKDASQYDPTFIAGLPGKNIKLVDDYVVIDGETEYIPKPIPLNKKITFQGARNDNRFTLAVTRTNFTNVKYDFQIVDKANKIIDAKSGVAILGSMFFLAGEVDEDEEDDYTAYLSIEYWDESSDCEFAVRIEPLREDANGEEPRAKVKYWCKDKNKPALDLDDCPTLRRVRNGA
jgi:hypothetical protein